MKRTLITRLSFLEQYDATTKTVKWTDGKSSRWNNVYSQLQTNDNIIFVVKGKLLIGTIEQINDRESISCINIQEVQCENDEFLRLHIIYPELASRVKASFKPFVHSQEINISQLITDATGRNFISFYILSNLEKYNELAGKFKTNDRIIILNSNHQFENVKLHTDNGLIDFQDELDVKLGVAGLNLEKVLEINKNVKRESAKSKNVSRIRRIISKISESGFYKFRSFSGYHDALYNKKVYGDPNFIYEEDSSTKNESQMNSEIPLNQILFGPPGTGKTYHTINKAIEIVNPKFDLTKDRKEIKIEYDRLKKERQIVFTTFHQSMSYEDFVEGIKPETIDEKVIYNIKDGIFKLICQKASSTKKLTFSIEESELELTPDIFQQHYQAFSEKLPSHLEEESPFELRTQYDSPFHLFKNSNHSIVVKAGEKRTPMVLSFNELSKVFFEKKSPVYKSYEQVVIDKILEGIEFQEKEEDNTQKSYVLIIDEINRGNVSQIFGELITLIEEDKRVGKEEALEVILPYSKKTFSVPSNLYIIGTMNTADRSVEALDTALRRRFNFEEMPPMPEIIKTNGKLKEQNGILKLDDYKIDLVSLLETINRRIEILLDKDHLIGHSFFMKVKNVEDLKRTFDKQIIPLLQEYFFGDYGKISLVLGEGFCVGKKEKKIKKVFAKTKNYDVDVFSEKMIYKIPKVFGLKTEDFVKAIKVLLNQESTSE